MNYDWVRRITFVNVILWGLRIGVVVVVFGGTLGSLITGKYSGEQWFDLLLFGLSMGSIYALIALGYTMVYGILRLINFAHGDIFMTGGFTGYFVINAFNRSGFLDQNPLISIACTLAVSMAVCVVIALIVERICYRPFRHVRTLAPLICAIGASFFLQHSFRGLYGSSIRAYPDIALIEGKLFFFGFDIPKVQVVVIVSAFLSMLILYTIVQRTKMGTAMRAVSEDRDAAALMGIDVNKVIVFTFILGGSMAGIAAVLYAFVFKQVFFFMGFFP